VNSGTHNPDDAILARLDPEGGYVALAEVTVGAALVLNLDEIYTPGEPVEHVVTFARPVGKPGDTRIDAEEIPELVDRLLELHRHWLRALES